jgi:hypothetical protein
MAFNSNTYHANKYAREAADYLRRAREAKTAATDWERSRVSHFAEMALSSSRLSRSYRKMAEERRRWREAARS